MAHFLSATARFGAGSTPGVDGISGNPLIQKIVYATAVRSCFRTLLLFLSQLVATTVHEDFEGEELTLTVTFTRRQTVSVLPLDMSFITIKDSLGQIYSRPNFS